MTSRPVLFVCVAAAAVALVAGTLPAPGAANEAKITGVYRTASCPSGHCRPGVDAPVVAGAAITGTIEVFVSASADLGLEFVRLEAQRANDPLWYCLEQWVPDGATTFNASRVWKTTNWTDPRRDKCAPGTCSSCTEISNHLHGIPTENGIHRLRVVAREQGQVVSKEPDAISSSFPVNVSNPPSAPSWIGAPEKNARPDPTVTLRWSASAEPDVSEYRFVRQSPSGAERVFAMDPSDPGRYGCSKIGSIGYACNDRGFAESGTYRYGLAAYRHGAGGERCALSAGTCLGSPLSPVKTISLTVASRAAPTSAGAAASPGSSPPQTAPAEQYRAPVALPQSEGAPAILPASRPVSRSRPASVLAVAAVLALLAAAILGRRIASRKTAS